MSDAYYELVDPDDQLGERFTASDHVISTWSPDMQNAAPVSALLVRAVERCALRHDTRVSRGKYPPEEFVDSALTARLTSIFPPRR